MPRETGFERCIAGRGRACGLRPVHTRFSARVIDLELGGGFGLPQNVDASFSTLLQMLDAGLRSALNGSAIPNSRSPAQKHR